MNRPTLPRACWTGRTFRQRVILLAMTPTAAGLIVAGSSVRHTAIPGWLHTVDSAAVLTPTVVLTAVAAWKTYDASAPVTAAVGLLAGVVGLAIATVGLYAGGLLVCLILLLVTEPTLTSGYLASADVLIRLGDRI